MEEPIIIGISLETLRTVIGEVIRTELQQIRPQQEESSLEQKMYTSTIIKHYLGVARKETSSELSGKVSFK